MALDAPILAEFPDPFQRLREFIKGNEKKQQERDDKDARKEATPTEKLDNFLQQGTTENMVLKRSLTQLMSNEITAQERTGDDIAEMFMQAYALEQSVDVDEMRARLQKGTANAQEDASGSISGMGMGALSLIKGIAGFIVKRVLFKMLKNGIVALLRFLVKRVLWGIMQVMWRFVIRFVIMGLVEAVGAVVATLGLPVIIGGLAIGGAGWFIYKKFFDKKAEPENVAPPSPDAQQPSGGLWERAIEWLTGKKVTRQTTTTPQQPSETGGAPVTATPVGDLTASQARDAVRMLRSRSQSVADVIHTAAQRVGENEAVMNAFAYQESKFDPNAGASTSSAKGLFQFIGGTWRNMVDKYGSRFGVARNASVFDPMSNALMGAAYLKFEIRPAITRVVSNPGATDLYFGHFLGPAGGARFLRGYYATPDALGVNFVEPAQARANYNVFYDKTTGRAKTLREIYAYYSGKFVPIEQYVAQQMQQGQTSSTPAQATKPADEKVAAKDNTTKANQQTAANTAAKADSKAASQLAANPTPQKDYVRTQDGKLLTVAS